MSCDNQVARQVLWEHVFLFLGFVHASIYSFDYLIFVFNEESSQFLAVKRFTKSTFEFPSLRHVLINCRDYITDHMGDVYKDLSK